MIAHSEPFGLPVGTALVPGDAVLCAVAQFQAKPQFL